MRLQLLPDLMECLRPHVPIHHLVAEPHDESPDVRVLGKHLDQGIVRYVSSVTRNYWEEDLLFFAKVDGCILLPKIQELLSRGLRCINFLSLLRPAEPPGMHEAVVVILR